MIFTDNLFDLTNILYVFLNVMVALAKAMGFIFHGKSVHNIFDSLNGRCFVHAHKVLCVEAYLCVINIVYLNVFIAGFNVQSQSVIGFSFIQNRSFFLYIDCVIDKDVIPQIWKQNDVIPSTLKHLRYVRWLFYGAGSVTCFLVIFTTDYANKKLPIGAWYPFDTIDFRTG